jgi:6-pyruvoyltetrahydropterin/6-carboxytetrahydropterin synthase
LDGLPDDHPCSRVHGHNYIAKLFFDANQLDSVGFVVDFRALDPFKKYIDGTFDHRHLNDVVPFNPTSEKLAEHLFGIACEMINDGTIPLRSMNPTAHVTSCMVSETEKTRAEYQAW